MLLIILKKRVESGQDFGFIAQNFSDDQTSAIKGGELGWFAEGQMVDLFNEVCFTSDIDELNIIETQFGVHLVQVMDKSKSIKKYKVAYIDRESLLVLKHIIITILKLHNL